MTALEELDVESDNNKPNKKVTLPPPAITAPQVTQQSENSTSVAQVETPKLNTPAKPVAAKTFGIAATVAAPAPAGPTLAKRKAAATEPNFP